MTQEEKAKRYDEAIERASKLRVQNPFDTVSQMMEHVFPELAESEDERIRKALIEYFTTSDNNSYYAVCGVATKKILAWLEKQGEKPQDKTSIEIWKGMRLEVYAQVSGNIRPNVSDDNTKMFSLNDIDEIIEKISEQKPTERVEPKFYKGEWITNCGWIVKIVEAKPLDYILQSQHGNIIDDTISYVDEHFHLWTIADAKPGDVLAFNNDTIVIFKDLYNSSTFHSYCHIEDGMFDISKDELPDWWEGKGFQPATKEQRDLLFQRMKEAGYEWDTEKKEPKKIVKPKFKVGDWCIDNEDDTIFQIVKVLDNTYTYKTIEGKEYSCTHYSLENDARLWTIQDAKNGDVVVDKSDGTIGIFQNIGHHPDGGSYNDPSYCFLHCRYDYRYFYADFENGNTIDSDDLIPATKEQRNTLMRVMTASGYKWDENKKELRKIEQKSKWTEEDEKNRNALIYLVKEVKSQPLTRLEDWDRYIDWLNSIKQRMEE